LGTAAYLSPEQVSTGDAGPSSDVYSIGILAYELLTGVTPFTGDSALAVAYQRMDNDVSPPSAVIAGVPAQFDELVLQATRRDPADRYADAQDMAAELDATTVSRGPSTPPPKPLHGHRRLPHPRLDSTPGNSPATTGSRMSPNMRLYQDNSPESTSTNSTGPDSGPSGHCCSG
jgi:serine/threonine-protein kinase